VAKAFEAMKAAHQHTFLTLTKQAARLDAFYTGYMLNGTFKMPNNIYNGLSITNQADADKNLPVFLQIPGKKWLSIEPMIGAIELEPFLEETCLVCYGTGENGPQNPCEACNESGKAGKISQVILGGMTGPKATPVHPDWVRKVRDDCAAAGVPLMFKQWGEYLTEETTFCGRPARLSCKVGKKAAGRMLDGREHNKLAWAINED
jgi:protein gp37